MSDVSVISGRLEVMGPSMNKGEGSEYTYLRIIEKSGNVKLIKKVGVGHLVESYLRPGVEGDFYFVKFGGLGFILFAIKKGTGEQIYEQNGFSVWIRTMRIMAVALAVLFIPLTLVGFLMGGWLGGIMVLVGFIYYIWKFGFSLPGALKDKDLKRQLNQRGFSC